jgi:signal transduction histidine kinase
MNDKRYQWILYVIVFVILGTISIQVYWNYKNYLVNKKQLINDVQVSLDNVVDAYYTKLAENSTIGFIIETTSNEDIFGDDGKFDSIMQKIDISRKDFFRLDSLPIDTNDIDGVKIFKGQEADSLLNSMHNNNHIKTQKKSTVEISKHVLSIDDSVSIKNLKNLTSKVIFSITQDSLELKSINTLLQKELIRKDLNINYGLSFNVTEKDTVNYNDSIIQLSDLNTISKSSFLPKNSTLKIYFTNETKVILKRIFTGILISTLLVLAVISCLFYLLNIIKHQKQLAEVKNDLISNITHEFKTPIATISVALESIKSFNVIEDKEKTKTYLDMSNNQLSKLNVMVEKLLETATLDSESLELNKELTNISDLLTTIINKHQIQTETKTINFTTSNEEIIANIDEFHFENAINNVLDNALKYGGEIISIHLTTHKNAFEIAVSDNGNTITKATKDKVFEKFYRIPKGNTHDVKGFGIGLYYTKKIIERHQGTIQLDLDNKQTTFKISLPNE